MNRVKQNHKQNHKNNLKKSPSRMIPKSRIEKRIDIKSSL